MIKFNYIENNYQFSFDTKMVIKKLLDVIVKMENIKTNHVISYIMVSREEIHKINKTYRNIDRETDVISFAMIDCESNHTLPFELGDVYICYDKVIEQAKEYGHSVLREFAFLVTHGTFHLLGYDHMKNDEEKIMFDKQEEVLQIANINR